jgi:hypothetical protein
MAQFHHCFTSSFYASSFTLNFLACSFEHIQQKSRVQLLVLSFGKSWTNFVGKIVEAKLQAPVHLSFKPTYLCKALTLYISKSAKRNTSLVSF